MMPTLDRAVRQAVRAVRFRLAHRTYRAQSARDPFARAGRALIQFLQSCEWPAAAPTGPPLGVVVTPWLHTAVPWYAIALAQGLLWRRERRVILIWDDTPFPDASADWVMQNRVIGHVLNTLPAVLPVIRLSDERPAELRREDRQHVEHLAELNAIWGTKAASLVESSVALRESYHTKLTHTLALVQTLLPRLDLECLVVPGGVFGSSGLFVLAGKEARARVATYDSGSGVIMFSTDGISAQQMDVPRAFRALWQSEPQIRLRAIAEAQEELRRRTQGTDRFHYQTSPAGSTQPDSAAGVLIPLNLEWDTAALGLHQVFGDTVAWLTETVEFILRNSDEPITVRQHPAERDPDCRSALRIASILHDRFSRELGRRVRFVAADEVCSTYDILQASKLVLPYVSTVGIEAAAVGKRVLVSGNSYYANLGFVWAARSRHEYFELLQRGLSGQLPLLPDQTDRAWLCYYLSQLCNCVSTDFTPMPEDFWTWSRRSPADLFADPVVGDILAAVDRNIPFNLIRHQRHLQDRQLGQAP